MGGFLGGLFSDLAAQVVRWVIETTAAMIGMIIGWILDSPDGVLEASAMQAMIRQGIAVGRYVLPIMVLLGVIQAGVQGRPGAVARLAFLEAPLVGAAMLVIAPVAGLLLAATDALTSWVINEAAIVSLQSAFNNLPAAAFLVAAPQSLPLVGVLSLVALVGAILVWGMMLMRNLGVALSVLVGPAMFATRLWPAAASWATTWVSFLVVLILVKPVIGFMLSLSWVMVGSGIDPAQGFLDIQALAMGLLAFLAAALVPSFMFKFVPQVGDTMAGRLSSGLGGVAIKTVGLATTVVFAAKSIGMVGPARGAGGSGAAGRVPISPAGRPPPPPPQGGSR
jgi:hypothetical protein